MENEKIKYAKGLEGVIAGESSICLIDGEKGNLYYRGYPIDELTQQCDFEEVTALLIEGDLPKKEQLQHFREEIRELRGLPERVRDHIRAFPAAAHPMVLLQSVSPLLSDPAEGSDTGIDCSRSVMLKLIARMTTTVATYERFRKGQDYLPPRKDLSHGANFLYLLRGKEPEAIEGEIMDNCFILHAEHSFNASTFTARVVASTLSPCSCSVSAAVGALYGTLHGGANEQVIDMIDKIGSVAGVEPWIDAALTRKEKVMGMGHRVYRAKDPRSVAMEGFLQLLSSRSKDDTDYHILKEIERVFAQRMATKGKLIYPNVDFFSGAVYRMLGIPHNLFTPIFAAARMAGWVAHILEQWADNRLYRPKALYVGEAQRPLPSR